MLLALGDKQAIIGGNHSFVCTAHSFDVCPELPCQLLGNHIFICWDVETNSGFFWSVSKSEPQ